MNHFDTLSNSNFNALETYVSSVNNLHPKFAHVSANHREMIDAMQRVANALHLLADTQRH